MGVGNVLVVTMTGGTTSISGRAGLLTVLQYLGQSCTRKSRFAQKADYTPSEKDPLISHKVLLTVGQWGCCGGDEKLNINQFTGFSTVCSACG